MMDKWIKAIGESNIKQNLKDEIVAALHEHAKCEPSTKPAYSKPKTSQTNKSDIVKGTSMPGKTPSSYS